jgi:hypothetical protein
MKFPFYTFILHVFLPRILSTQSYIVSTNNRTIFWLSLSLVSSFWVDLGSNLNMFPTKPSKTINPPGKLEGNAARRAHNDSLTRDSSMSDCNNQVFVV